MEVVVPSIEVLEEAAALENGLGMPDHLNLNQILLQNLVGRDARENPENSILAIRESTRELSGLHFEQLTSALKQILTAASAHSPEYAKWSNLVCAVLDGVERTVAPDQEDSHRSIVEELAGGLIEFSVAQLSARGNEFLSIAAIVIECIPELEELRDALFGEGRADREEETLRCALQLATRCSQLNGSFAGSESAVQELHKILDEIRAQQSACKVVTDFPRISADGLMRTKVFHQTAEVFSENRASKGLDPHTCDLVIIGGGPAGIAAAYHAGRLGVDAVLFEGGYLAQAMSDARAQSVHVMRTNMKQSSLFPQGIVPGELSEELGMPALMAREGIRPTVIAAREEMEARLGSKFFGALPRQHETEDVPVARAEVFTYFLHIAEEAASFRNITLLEQAPIKSIEWDEVNKVFHIASCEGHRLSCRKLAVATGFVGSEAEWGKLLPDLADLAKKRPGDFLSLANEHDLYAHNAKLKNALEEQREQLIISEPLLGHQDIKHYLSTLRKGTRVAVVGSGESAAKAVLEILCQNPNLKVDLFVKHPLEPAQLQAPLMFAPPTAVLRGLRDAEFGLHTIELRKKSFGTPITPETMLDLLKLVEKRDVRIFELGEHFSEKALDLKVRISGGRVVTDIEIDKDAERVGKNLRHQQSEWASYGIEGDRIVPTKGSRRLSTITGPLVVAVGYDRERLHSDDPIFRTLADQGLIKLEQRWRPNGGEVAVDPERPSFSSNSSNLVLLGAGNLNTDSNGRFNGIAAQAYLAMEEIKKDLQDNSSSGFLYEIKKVLVDAGRAVLRGVATLSPWAKGAEPRAEPAPDLLAGIRNDPKLKEISAKDSPTKFERLLLNRALKLQGRLISAIHGD